MISSKMSIPRRTFLRGAGVTLALPLLDAMFPAPFLALLAPQLRRPGAPVVAAISGALLATALVPVAPVGVPILFSAFGVIPGLIVLRRGQVAA